MAEIDNILKSIDNYCSHISSAGVWQNSREALGIERDQGKKGVRDDYIYEFYCYIRIVCDLKKNYVVRYIEGTGENRNQFPRSPANKEGRPRFHLLRIVEGEQDKLVAQVCSGTTVRTEYASEDVTPDISFQLGTASENPTSDDVILIFDAKFKKNPNDRVPNNTIRDFIEIVNLLGLKCSAKAKIKFDKLDDLDANCLLTNGKPHKDEAHDYLYSRSVREVFNFGVLGEYTVIGKLPTSIKHVAIRRVRMIREI